MKIIVCILMILAVSAQAQIQELIDVAKDGDIVAVPDGIYAGDLDFKGKAITLKSANGPANCIIDCEGNGRGFYFHNHETKNSILDGFTIKNGNPNDDGGAIFCRESSPVIQNNIIIGNSANSGAGIFCFQSSAKIQNNVIVGNSANDTGGGIYSNSSNLIIVNNTISGNIAGWDGGGIAFRNSSSKVINTILWDNSPQSILILDDSSITISHSLIDIDPLFTNGYHLDDFSPCIGAGTPDGASEFDIEGNLRGTPPDIGAYESPRDTPLPVLLSSFSATRTQEGVKVVWETGYEIQNLGFNIWYSPDKKDWQKIKWVESAGPKYSFTDRDSFSGYYYLEDVSLTGEKEKSKIIKVQKTLTTTWGKIKQK